jgi:hypothetical protein
MDKKIQSTTAAETVSSPCHTAPLELGDILVRDQNGSVETRHYLQTNDGVVQVEVETTFATKTIVRTKRSAWPEHPGSRVYLHTADGCRLPDDWNERR